MLNTIIAVFIANIIFFAVWIIVGGFFKSFMYALEDAEWEKKNSKKAKVEKRPFQTCGDPECECSNMDCD